MKPPRFTDKYIEECVLQAIDYKLLGYMLYCVVRPTHNNLRTLVSIKAAKFNDYTSSIKEIVSYETYASKHIDNEKEGVRVIDTKEIERILIRYNKRIPMLKEIEYIERENPD